MFIWRSHRWCRPYTVPLKSKLPVASRFLRDENRVARESSNRKVLGRQCWILDSTPCIWDSGYWYSIPYSLKWNLDFRFQSLMGFWIPWAVLQISQAKLPGFRDPDGTGFVLLPQVPVSLRMQWLLLPATKNYKLYTFISSSLLN